MAFFTVMSTLFACESTSKTPTRGVVYYANYLKFSNARVRLVEGFGDRSSRCYREGIGVYAVVEVKIKYRKPAKLDDDLLIVSRLAQLRGVSWRSTKRCSGAKICSPRES